MRNIHVVIFAWFNSLQWHCDRNAIGWDNGLEVTSMQFCSNPHAYTDYCTPVHFCHLLAVKQNCIYTYFSVLVYRYAYHMPQSCYIYMFAVNPASSTIWYIVDGYITCLHVCAVLLKVNESSATAGSQGELLSRRCVTLLKAALRSDVWPNSELKLNWSVWCRITRNISHTNRAC